MREVRPQGESPGRAEELSQRPDQRADHHSAPTSTGDSFEQLNVPDTSCVTGDIVIRRASQALSELKIEELPPTLQQLPTQLAALIYYDREGVSVDVERDKVALEALQPDQLAQVYQVVTSTLSSSSDYCRGLHPDILTALATKQCSQIGGVQLKHINPLSSLLLLGTIAVGAASPYGPTIYSSIEPPTERETLRDLLTTGTLPEYYITILHEWTHTQQVTGAQYMSNVVASLARTAMFAGAAIAYMTNSLTAALTTVAALYTNRFFHARGSGTKEWQLLKEVHAYESELVASCSTTEGEDKAHVLSTILCSKSYVSEPSARVEVAPSGTVLADGKESPLATLLGNSWEQIRALKLLGAAPEDINAVVASCTFDPSSNSFPELTQALAAKRTGLELMDDTIYGKCLVALQAGYELHRRALRRHAQEITRNALAAIASSTDTASAPSINT